MGNLKGASISEIRVYDDPNNPVTSDYKVSLPVTAIPAVLDPVTGQPLNEILDTIRNGDSTVLSELNEINANIGAITASIGSNTDSEGTSSVFSWFARLWNQITSIFTPSRLNNLDNLSNIDATLGRRGDTAALEVSDTESAMSYLKGIMTNLQAASGIREIRFDTPGTYTWTVPAGVTGILVTACGAGGSGSTGGSGSNCGGGGAAAIVKRKYAVTPDSALTTIIGAGGVNGNSGAVTVIGALVTLPGGAGGNSGGASGGPGGGDGGGATSGGNGGIAGSGGGGASGGGGSLGGGGGSGVNGLGGSGGNGIYGSGGDSSLIIGVSGSGAAGGAAGGAGSSNGAGGGGGSYGAGGGSGGTNASGGDGGNGLVIIEW